MIEVCSITKKYGRVAAVKNLSFTVEKGEILGFLGPNGAGKTTTMNIITGYIPPTEGNVIIDNMNILENPKEVKTKIGYAPEIPAIYTEMTVEGFLYFASEIKKVSQKDREKEIDRVAGLAGIKEIRKRLIRNLSKGYKQRIGIAQALLGNPEILVLDEPTAGLDPKQIIEIRNLIKELGKEHTIILSSHILPEVNAVCDRVIIINKGEIAAIDTPENLSNLLGGSGKVQVKIDGLKEKVVKALETVKGIVKIEIIAEDSEGIDYLIESEPAVDIRKSVFFLMAEKKHTILEMKKHGMSLEEVFLQLTTSENKEVE